jgi:hypothetical protein
MMGCRGRRVFRVREAVVEELRAYRVRRAILVFRGLLAAAAGHRAFKALKVRQEPQVRREPKVRLELPVLRAHRARTEQMERRAHKVLPVLEFRALKA